MRTFAALRGSLLGSRRGSLEARLFLVCWILLGVHFATNIVREHYPAFALVDHGSFRVDEYLGLHSDIFQHSDGHAYIDNNVAASVVAAVPLFAFDPVLDRLEQRRKAEIAASPASADGEYRSEYPMRAEFYREVRRRGLDLRFGAATAITALLLMAPVAALCAVLVLRILRRSGVSRGRAAALAFVFAFGTPVFFRAATLNPNLLVAACALGAFYLLLDLRGDRRDDPSFAAGAIAPRGDDAAREGPSARRVAGAGLLAGAAVAFDYSGVVVLAGLFAWILCERRSVRDVLGFGLGALPALSFLLSSQWIQFGDPFLPAQRWMPDAHFSERGWRGFSLPQPDLLLANLFDPDFGLFVYGPILLFALVPARRGEPTVLPRRARGFALALSAAFLLFCASNQYTRMQWNSGFRHLLPIVPFLFLAACDALARLPRTAFAVVCGLAVLHEWVLAMVRYHPQPQDLGDFAKSAVVESWRRFLEGGVQLPAIEVLRRTAPQGAAVQAWYWPYAALLVCALAALAVWRVSARGTRGASGSNGAGSMARGR